MDSAPKTMAGQLNRAWRVFGTGLSFVIFGLVALVTGFTLFPLLCLSTRDPDVAHRRAQWLVHKWFGVFVNFMRLVGVISFEVHGAEKLKRPGIMIIANHPSLIDVVLLIAYVRQADCIIKRAVFDNPFMKWPCTWASYICHNTPKQLIADCVAALNKGHSLMIFPESTRTVPGQPIRMMRGAARIALESGATVVPVTITCEPLMLNKGVPWYRVPPRPGHYVLSVGDPYPVPRCDAEAGNVRIATHRLTHQWEQYFATRTGGQPAHPVAEPGAQYSALGPL